MLRLIIAVCLGLGIGYFATWNTGWVQLRFGDLYTAEVPLYAAVVGGVIAGLVMGWLLSLVKGVSDKVVLYSKENELKAAKEKVGELTKRVHRLELEKARLAPEGSGGDEDSM